MKKYRRILIGIGGVLILLLSIGCNFPSASTNGDIKLAARRASVQPVFYIPTVKVSFTDPLEEEKSFTKEDIAQLLKTKIQEAIEQEKVEQAKNKHSTYLVTIDVWGYKVISQTHVPLSALAPKWAKFPDKVLVVCEVEKKEINGHDKEYKKDVMAISETANVSLSQSTLIIRRLRAEGYSISKEELAEATTVKLLHFSDWDDEYPTTLNWSVEVIGTENNLIIGYDPRGILEIRPVAGDVRLHVSAGYFDLRDEYKPKTDQVKELESRIEILEEDGRVLLYECCFWCIFR